MTDVDVAVIGAGPGGCTAAALLAASGLRVKVIERERFPRFHIGESLLPACEPILARMGVDLDALGYLRKYGAEFYDEATGDFREYPFAEGLSGAIPYTHQVERSTFDNDLVDAVRRAGAEVELATSVVDVQIDERAVAFTLAETPAGPGPDEGRTQTRAAPDRTRMRTLRARYFVDAGGRRPIAGTGRDPIAIDGLGRAACFVHYSALSEPAWTEVAERGNVKVLKIPDGWIWVIPLTGYKLSVGVVLRRGKVHEHLVDEQVALSPLLQRLTAGAQVSESRRIADFSYANRSTCSARRVTIGDASGFLDPVFSSGVTLAMTAAERMAARLVPALADGREGDATLMVPLSEEMAVAYRSFHAIAHRFYNTGLLQNFLFAGAPEPDLRAGLISLLAGDMWRTDNRFQDLVTAANRFELPPTPWN